VLRLSAPDVEQGKAAGAKLNTIKLDVSIELVASYRRTGYDRYRRSRTCGHRLVGVFCVSRSDAALALVGSKCRSPVSYVWVMD
jgi:hypothetical protein